MRPTFTAMEVRGGARIFGLDVMRAAAIFMVVYGHTAGHLTASFLDEPGYLARDGVGLFFVLSGYLVGGIALRMKPAGWRTVLDFWQRRWFRTLPNYYLFLLINIGLVYVGIRPGVLNENGVVFFFFLQNLVRPIDLFFGESWSLAVEEWFYLILPLLVGLFTWRLPFKWGSLIATLVLLVIPAWWRYVTSATVWDPLLFDAYVGMIVVQRLDAIAWGVLAIWLMTYLPGSIARVRWPFFAMGLVGAVLLFRAQDWNDIRFSANIYFTASAACMALLLPVLAGWRCSGPWAKLVAFISNVSFALYLVHIPMRHHFFDLFGGGSVVEYLMYWIVCIALATIVHRVWERPFMELRERVSAWLVRKDEVPRSDVAKGYPRTPG